MCPAGLPICLIFLGNCCSVFHEKTSFSSISQKPYHKEIKIFIKQRRDVKIFLHTSFLFVYTKREFKSGGRSIVKKISYYHPDSPYALMKFQNDLLHYLKIKHKKISPSSLSVSVQTARLVTVLDHSLVRHCFLLLNIQFWDFKRTYSR